MGAYRVTWAVTNGGNWAGMVDGTRVAVVRRDDAAGGWAGYLLHDGTEERVGVYATASGAMRSLDARLG